MPVIGLIRVLATTVTTTQDTCASSSVHDVFFDRPTFWFRWSLFTRDVCSLAEAQTAGISKSKKRDISRWLRAIKCHHHVADMPHLRQEERPILICSSPSERCRAAAGCNNTPEQRANVRSHFAQREVIGWNYVGGSLIIAEIQKVCCRVWQGGQRAVIGPSMAFTCCPVFFF